MLCCVLIVHVYNEAVCWVGVCEGGEVAEEGVVAVVVLEYIACYAVLDEGHEKDEEEYHGVPMSYGGDSGSIRRLLFEFLRLAAVA